MLTSLPNLALGEGRAIAPASRRNRPHRPHRDRDRRRRGDVRGRRRGRRAVATRAIVWAAGVTASGLAGKLAELTGAEHDRAGRITVESDLTLPGTRRCSRSATWCASGTRAASPSCCPASHQSRRSKGGTRRASSARGSEAANTGRSATATREPGHDRPRSGSRRHQRRPARRLCRLGNMAARPPLVNDRLPESGARPHPVVVQLRDPRSWRPTHHRRFDTQRAALMWR